MTCPREDLVALADGALPSARAAEVEGHLAGCADCAAALALIRAGIAALAALPPPPPPSPFFGARLEARLARAREARARPGLLAALRGRLAIPLVGTLAAAAIALVVVRDLRARDREVAANLELLEDWALVQSLDEVASAEDAAVIAELDALEARP
jgi:anti-sigma factor RsiW